MSNSSDRTPVPRATIHKRILDAAADRPEESLETLADDIPGASTELVERVLDEYGDPASDQPDSHAENGTSPSAKGTDDLELAELSANQRELLRAIYDNPEATQQELGELFDVSSPTICNRVNAIDGFEWPNRQAFVTPLFNGDSPEVTEETESMETTNTESHPEIEQLNDRMRAIEQELATLSQASEQEEASGQLDDPELVQKVVHACMESDTISGDEELRLLETFLR